MKPCPHAPRPGAQAALAAALALGAAGCLRFSQRVPGPLPLPERPGEAPAAPPGGAAGQAFGALVQRDSDPVWIRRPGERGDYLLPFYRKRERVGPGSSVRTGARGRAEILWAPDASSLVLFDEARATLGDPGRDEPLVRLHTVTHALFVLTPEDEIELPGGALLRGDPAESIGPVLLERCGQECLRLTNQTGRAARVAYRDRAVELQPGESLDLPLLDFGCAPLPPPEEPARIAAAGIALSLRGRAEHEEQAGAVRLRASEPSEIAALGVRVRLAAGEELRLSTPGSAREQRMQPASGEAGAPRP